MAERITLEEKGGKLDAINPQGMSIELTKLVNIPEIVDIPELCASGVMNGVRFEDRVQEIAEKRGAKYFTHRQPVYIEGRMQQVVSFFYES